LLKRFDANNDGELDADERAQMARFLQQQQQQMQQQRGRAGFGPPPAAERASKLDQSALLERFDTDKNGQLDAQERQAALEQIRQRLANTKPADKE
jgi:Ca2+-binding EF-hand superfamily protein